MPGVLDFNSDSGVSREVGKMAFYIDMQDMQRDLLDFDAAEFDEIAERIFSSSADNSESEGEMLPDEQTVDLVKMMDYHESDEPLELPRSMLLCEADCNHCKEKVGIKVSGNKDPFMGSTLFNRSATDSGSSMGASILGQIMCPLEEQNNLQQTPQTEVFNAWSHTSNTDEYHVFTKSSFSGLVYQEEDAEEGAFPDSSSTYSDNGVGGDDSDVDIETVTETPRSGSIYGDSSVDCSPLSTPSGSPTPIQSLQKDSLMSILSRSPVSSKLLAQSSSAKSLLRVNSQGISSSASLAENLMIGRSSSTSGQKRKQQKEKMSAKLSLQQPVYSHVLVNSNSVNFHDYAMSPGSNTASTETGRPTVMAKRIYRKRQYNSIDASDKEKQHHHNQLERNRRQKLADLFTDLRDEIPKIRHQSKASKVVILNEATVYINELNRLSSDQEDEVSSLLQKQLYLEKQLRHLEAQRSSSH